MHFWSFSAKYCHFLHILSNARPKTNLNKVPRWVFRYVGNKTFDFSSKKRIFCLKYTKFSLKLAFLSIAGHWCPVGGLAGGCGAGCISQDTYILYILSSRPASKAILAREASELAIAPEWAVTEGQEVSKEQ